jgi:hypothetical protein
MTSGCFWRPDQRLSQSGANLPSRCAEPKFLLVHALGRNAFVLPSTIRLVARTKTKRSSFFNVALKSLIRNFRVALRFSFFFRCRCRAHAPVPASAQSTGDTDHDHRRRRVNVQPAPKRVNAIANNVNGTSDPDRNRVNGVVEIPQIVNVGY